MTSPRRPAAGCGGGGSGEGGREASFAVSAGRRCGHGFVGYDLIEADNGVVGSLGLFETREQGAESTKAVASSFEEGPGTGFLALGSLHQPTDGYSIGMTDPRPIGILLLIGGAVGTAISALADPLGIGEGNVFGWLQITGVVIGAVVTLLGLVIATEWVPIPGRGTRSDASQNTTVVSEQTRSRPRT